MLPPLYAATHEDVCRCFIVGWRCYYIICARNATPLLHLMLEIPIPRPAPAFLLALPTSLRK